MPLNAYESERFDDSSDEDFMSDAIQSEPSDVEDSVEEKHGPSSRAAPYYPNDTSFVSSTRHHVILSNLRQYFQWSFGMS